MKKMSKFVSLVLAMMLVLSMGSVAAAEGALKIGFIGPLTGGAAVYGISAKQGAEIAVQEINEKGGLQIEFLAEDDENDPEKSVNAYYNLMDWNAQVINGCVTSTPCAAVAAEAYADRVFMLTPSASSPSVTEGRDMMYQICFTDPEQGKTAAKYIGENALATKVAIIYNNADAYSTGIYQGFVAEAENQPFEVVAVESFSDDANPDFSVQLNAAKNAEADLVFLPIYYTPASTILNQAKNMEYQPQFFGADGMDGILTMEGFDVALAENVMLLTPFDLNDPETASFAEKYMTAYGTMPTQFAADSYDAIYALYDAMVACNVTPDMKHDEICELLVQYFPTMTFKGTTGTMQWDATGVVTKVPLVVKIVDGAYVTQ